VRRILAAESRHEGATRQVLLSRHEEDFKSSFSFIFLGFKDKSFYWEVLVMLRKTLLVSLTVAFKFDRRLLGHLGLLIYMYASIAHSRRLPYVNDVMNKLEYLSLFCTSSTFYLGGLTLANESGREYTSAASVLAFSSVPQKLAQNMSPRLNWVLEVTRPAFPSLKGSATKIRTTKTMSIARPWRILPLWLLVTRRVLRRRQRQRWTRPHLHRKRTRRTALTTRLRRPTTTTSRLRTQVHRPTARQPST
jgi:hypothetical protein